MKLIYLHNIIDFKNGKYHISFIIERGNGQIATCEKTCETSQEADTVYKELQEILAHDNPNNTIIVNAETINNL